MILLECKRLHNFTQALTFCSPTAIVRWKESGLTSHDTGRTKMTVPTLEDVAQQAGVSTATVSRCLNTPGRVSVSTREKVMIAVRELGYAPNFSARALKLGA